MARVGAQDWIGIALNSDRYMITDKLGEGGMGFVFGAHDRHLDTRLVIKIPLPAMMADPVAVKRFTRETRSLVQLSHPHIVKILDVGEHEGLPFAVMQFLGGGSLKDRQEQSPGFKRPLPADSLRDWLADIAKALDYVHAQGFIHRDVKPANILFDEAGNAYLSDFGIIKGLSHKAAEQHGSTMTETGMVLGTPDYMAPEVIQEQGFDGRVDQYALAVTVFEILSGQLPFTGPTSAAVLIKHSTTPAPPLDRILPWTVGKLARAVDRGLSKRPQDRFSSCRELADAVLAGINAAPPTPTAAVRLPTMTTRPAPVPSLPRPPAPSLPPPPPPGKAATGLPPGPTRGPLAAGPTPAIVSAAAAAASALPVVPSRGAPPAPVGATARPGSKSGSTVVEAVPRDDAGQSPRSKGWIALGIIAVAGVLAAALWIALGARNDGQPAEAPAAPSRQQRLEAIGQEIAALADLRKSVASRVLAGMDYGTSAELQAQFNAQWSEKIAGSREKSAALREELAAMAQAEGDSALVDDIRVAQRRLEGFNSSEAAPETIRAEAAVLDELAAAVSESLRGNHPKLSKATLTRARALLKSPNDRLAVSAAVALVESGDSSALIDSDWEGAPALVAAVLDRRPPPALDRLTVGALQRCQERHPALADVFALHLLEKGTAEQADWAIQACCRTEGGPSAAEIEKKLAGPLKAGATPIFNRLLAIDSKKSLALALSLLTKRRSAIEAAEVDLAAVGENARDDAELSRQLRSLLWSGGPRGIRWALRANLDRQVRDSQELGSDSRRLNGTQFSDKLRTLFKLQQQMAEDSQLLEKALASNTAGRLSDDDLGDFGKGIVDARKLIERLTTTLRGAPRDHAQQLLIENYCMAYFGAVSDGAAALERLLAIYKNAAGRAGPPGQSRQVRLRFTEQGEWDRELLRFSEAKRQMAAAWPKIAFLIEETGESVDK